MSREPALAALSAGGASPLSGALAPSAGKWPYFRPTIDTLADRAGNRCSNPNCLKPTSGPRSEPTKAVNIGAAAHIIAAAPGSPRYDPELTPEQRSGIDNGIWLCQNCHKLVDNDPDRYPAELLRRWKTEAEQRAIEELEGLTPRQPAAAPYQPPRPLAEFVGREEPIARLTDLLQPGSKTAITGLIGMGGIGKTELAKLVADRVADRFRDGVLWADCGEQALAIARDIGDRRGEAIHSWNLGLLYEGSDPARAVELMQVCVDYEREISHPDAEAHARRVDQLRAKLST